MTTRPLTRLRKLCLSLAEAHEVEAWGAPTFRVTGGTIFAMYAAPGNHHGAGREGVWVKAPPGNQALMVRDAPRQYFVPPYVGPKGWVGVFLDDDPDWDELQAMLLDAHRMSAPKKLLRSLDVALAKDSSAKVAKAKGASTKGASAPATRTKKKVIPAAKPAARAKTATSSPEPDAEEQLAEFLDKYLPEIVTFTKAVRAALRRRMPGAVEMVYDNYNALVIGFGPTERPSEAILSIVPMPQHVSLAFLQGAQLPDPDGLLLGSGTVARHIRLDSPAMLQRPGVSALIDMALERAKVPLDPRRKRQLIIKSVSAKQRPRRPKA